MDMYLYVYTCGCLYTCSSVCVCVCVCVCVSSGLHVRIPGFPSHSWVTWSHCPCVSEPPSS